MKRIVSALLLCACAVARGATVTGNLVDATGDANTPAQIRFIPATIQRVTGVATTLDVIKRVVPTNGVFSVNLIGGNYDVDFGLGGQLARIRVPINDTNTYPFNDLVRLANSGRLFWTNNFDLPSSRVYPVDGAAATTNNPGTIYETVAIGGGASNSLVTARGSRVPRYLSDRFADTINVRDYGALGDGTPYDSTAIQYAINACPPGGTVFVPAGTYLLKYGETLGVGIYSTNQTTMASCLVLHGNMTLDLGSAVLQIETNSWGTYNILLVQNLKDVTIKGGTVLGDVRGRSDLSGEWGYGISIFGSTNVTIDGTIVSDCHGDGIVAGYGVGGNPSRNVKVRNVVCSGNWRNGSSVLGAFDVAYDNCKFTGTHGTAPQDGVDVEPADTAWGPGPGASNIVFRACHFSGNSGGGLTFQGLNAAGISGPAVFNCLSESNGYNGIVVTCGGVGVQFGGTIQGCIARGNKAAGIAAQSGNNYQIVNNQSYLNGTYGILSYDSIGGSVVGNTVYANSQSTNGGYPNIYASSLSLYAIAGNYCSTNGTITGLTNFPSWAIQCVVPGSGVHRSTVQHTRTGGGIYGEIDTGSQDVSVITGGSDGLTIDNAKVSGTFTVTNLAPRGTFMPRGLDAIHSIIAGLDVNQNNVFDVSQRGFVGVGVSNAVLNLCVSAQGAESIEFGPAHGGAGVDDLNFYNRTAGTWDDARYMARSHHFWRLGGAEDLTLTNGFAGFGNTNPQFKADVTGAINSTAGYYLNGTPYVGVTNNQVLNGDIKINGTLTINGTGGTSWIGTNTSVGTLTTTNAVVYLQLSGIPTNAILASTSSTTNWTQCNIYGIPFWIATNYATAGAFIKIAPGSGVTTWP